MLLNFKLKPPLECIFPKNERGNKYVSWFYLTDSEYFIDLGKIKLFEHSPQWIEKHKKEYPLIGMYDEYQYSRHLEDLFEILPTIACPMPEDLYSLVDAEEKRDLLDEKVVNLWDDEVYTDAIYTNITKNLLYYGNLDTGYLRVKSDCQFFNVGGKVIIHYNFIDKLKDGCPIWSACKGTYTLEYNEFICEIEDLLNRFFNAMDEQVKIAMQVFNEKELEKSNLILEHSERKDYFYSILSSIKNNVFENRIDWKKVREDLNIF